MVHRLVGVQLEIFEVEVEVLVVVVKELLSTGVDVVSAMLYILLLQVSSQFDTNILSYYLTLDRVSSICLLILLLVLMLHVSLLLCIFMFIPNRRFFSSGSRVPILCSYLYMP